MRVCVGPCKICIKISDGTNLTLNLGTHEGQKKKKKKKVKSYKKLTLRKESKKKELKFRKSDYRKC